MDTVEDGYTVRVLDFGHNIKEAVAYKKSNFAYGNKQKLTDEQKAHQAAIKEGAVKKNPEIKGFGNAGKLHEPARYPDGRLKHPENIPTPPKFACGLPADWQWLTYYKSKVWSEDELRGYQHEQPEPEFYVSEEMSDDRKRAVRHAKRSVRHHILSMQADHMVTCTYRRNERDLDVMKSDLKKFIRRVRTKYPNWQCVGGFEQQERGAWHCHLAVHGFQNIKWLRICWYSVVGEWHGMPDGQVNVSYANKYFRNGSKHVWKMSSLAMYLGKYISKTFLASGSGAASYYASRGIAKPTVSNEQLDAALSYGDAVSYTWAKVTGGEYGADNLDAWLDTKREFAWFLSYGSASNCKNFEYEKYFENS